MSPRRKKNSNKPSVNCKSSRKLARSSNQPSSLFKEFAQCKLLFVGGTFMMIQLSYLLCMLTVVIVGMLVMLQAVSLETCLQGLWRGVVVLVGAFIAWLLFRGLLLPILICSLIWLRQAMLAALLIVLALIAGLFAWKFAIPAPRKRDGGER